MLKPYAQKVRDALESGEAKYVETTGKHIYLFKLKKERKEMSAYENNQETNC